MAAFKRIGIIGKYEDKTISHALDTLRDHLLTKNVELLLDKSAADYWPNHGLKLATRSELGKKCDLIIVTGGDGTFLGAARSLAGYEPALLGINLGHLGFLTDISPDEMLERLDAIFDGKYYEEERFLLNCRVLSDGEEISNNEAFNDVVVHKWDVARMIELDAYVNGVFIYKVYADGLIISTPTGSTAYALSGGGPLLHPELDAVVLVPICPHTMSNRPIVVSADSKLELVIRGRNESRAQVSCDGQITIPLIEGDRIVVSKKKQPIRLIHPQEHDHYQLLRAKLNWGN